RKHDAAHDGIRKRLARPLESGARLVPEIGHVALVLKDAHEHRTEPLVAIDHEYSAANHASKKVPRTLRNREKPGNYRPTRRGRSSAVRASSAGTASRHPCNRR